ncbi:MAG: membrane integrity-associated transporter subunit PqiC [Alphaproteobacteria bacterium]|nr:membrane integrity-associated transporter subunit PqiC [Alphaproteobacteria bacterium]MBV9694151.1 membrane integrity-associated transporter subunit PqiC [Alphaproteobacteria bacterium]
MTPLLAISNRRAVLLGGSAFVLAACGDLIGPASTPQQLYSLKPQGAAPMPGPKADFSLAVQASTASQHLDSLRIALAQSDGRVDYYADAAWTDRLHVLVQSALVEAFESSGRIAAVAAEGEGFQADYILDADIRDFEARYALPDGIPAVRVRIVAKLAPIRGRAIVAELNSVHDVPASENSVAAVVRAFDAALGQALSDIVPWALSAAHGKGGG